MINLLAAFMFGGLGIYLLRRSFYLRKKGRFAIGNVVRFEQGRRGARVAIIQFTTSKGHEVEIRGEGATFPVYHLEDPVPILYNPKNPRDAIIYSSDYLWFLPLGLIGFGLYLVYDLVVHTIGVVK